MKTVLLICAADRDTISELILDALREQHVADVVDGIDFSDLEGAVHGCADVDQIVIFPCVIGLSDALRRDLVARIQVLQQAHPQVGISLTNPLGADPRLTEMIHDRLASALKGAQDAPILIVGDSSGTQTFRFADLQALPDQIEDVSTIVPNRRGQGVWARAVLDEVVDAHATFFADDDRFSSSVDLALVRERGLLIYAMDGEPLPPSFGGPLRLLIPNYDDRCANVKGVARIEVCEKSKCNHR